MVITTHPHVEILCGTQKYKCQAPRMTITHHNSSLYFFFFFNIFTVCLQLSSYYKILELYKNVPMCNFWNIFKGIVHPKIKILSLIAHLHVVPNPKTLFIFGTNESFLTLHRQPGNYHIQAQKSSTDIIKIVHVTSVVQP